MSHAVTPNHASRKPPSSPTEVKGYKDINAALDNNPSLRQAMEKMTGFFSNPGIINGTGEKNEGVNQREQPVKRSPRGP